MVRADLTTNISSQCLEHIVRNLGASSVSSAGLGHLVIYITIGITIVLNRPFATSRCNPNTVSRPLRNLARRANCSNDLFESVPRFISCSDSAATVRTRRSKHSLLSVLFRTWRSKQLGNAIRAQNGTFDSQGKAHQVAYIAFLKMIRTHYRGNRFLILKGRGEAFDTSGQTVWINENFD